MDVLYVVFFALHNNKKKVNSIEKYTKVEAAK